MAVLALPLAASAALSAAGVAAGSLLATAAITVATGVGAMIDLAIVSALMGPIKNTVTGPRLDNARVTTSIEGETINKVFGHMRVPGQLFWATRFKEVEVTETQTQSGGKGFGGGGSVETTTTTYQYYCSFAVALSRGPIIKVGRIWADGKLLDLKDKTYRIYYGTETQTRDPKIEAVEGTDATPAFRGTAYIVFEELFLEPFGNRIPQLNFEIWSFARDDEGELEFRIPGMNIIPGSSEYAYSPHVVRSLLATEGVEGVGWQTPSDNPNTPTERIENQGNSLGLADWEVAIDDLQSIVPNINKAQLVVTWFGTDLRLQNCEIIPKVETHDKTAQDANDAWWSGNVPRASAEIVSTDAIGPLVGGTPSDRSVYQAIQDLNTRGLNVSFYPFIFMDIPADNVLPNPYSNNAATIGQPPFPWRGRIVPSPAPGFTGSPDKTATVSTYMDTFFGTAAGSDFGSWNGLTIPYTGPNEWSYRRFILHYAKLCAAAGGVDLFYIGTEMVQMTTARSGTSTYPAVSKLVTLAADVSAILGGSTKVSYAADWVEWSNHRPSDGSGDVHFHLDPLWASSDIDYISIDNYMPLSDWRDTPDHLDSQDFDYIYDQEYLQGNIEGGELYDWYYASSADRISQTRTTITDGAYSKPWVHRIKDIRNWWLNQHYNRPGGTESGSPTAWTPESKQIIFSELGCPAIDKGSNQPNVFYDPKSSESFFPYFSSGGRDDYIQRMYCQAWIDYWLDNSNNPLSSVGGVGRMIRTSDTCLWTWDARPYPEFPTRTDLWRDGDNWRLGHWLNGRLGQVTLPDLVTAVTDDLNVTVDVSKLFGLVAGYTLDRIMSAREAIEPLALLYMFDSYESQGQIRFRHRGGKINWTISDSELVPIEEGTPYRLSRTQDLELPDQSIIKFIRDNGSYDQGVAQSKRLLGNSQRVAESSIAVVTGYDKVKTASDIVLMDAWLSRERISVKLPPSMLAADPTDIIQLTVNGFTNEYRIEEVNFQYELAAELVRTDRGLYFRSSAPPPTDVTPTPEEPAQPLVDFVEIPLRRDSEAPGGPFLAVYANPWQANAVYRSPQDADYVLDKIVNTPSHIGSVVGDITAGPEDTWDMGTVLTVQMYNTTTPLESKDEISVLGGRNLGAIKCANGEWEIIQWVTATLVGDGTYELTQLLRARLGTERAMYSGAPDTSQFVVLEGLTQSTLGIALRNVDLFWKIGPTSRSISDSSFRSVEYTPLVIGLRPYSPVQLDAVKESDDDWAISWVRRTRLPESGDTWEGLDVPLAEEFEKYEVDFYNAAGTSVVRTVTVDDLQSYTYSAADQTTDHGADIEFLDYSVSQISLLYGRGTPRRVRADMHAIKSVTNYTVTIAAGASSATQALSPSVDKNHAYAYNNGLTCAESSINHSEDIPRVELTDNNTVTVYTNAANASNARVVEVQVVEYYPWAATVQHGTISNGSGNLTTSWVPNTSVDYHRSVPIHLGSTSNNAVQGLPENRTRLSLNNAGTQVSSVRASSTGTVVTGVALVQFHQKLVVGKHALSVTITSGNSKTDTISQINRANSIGFWAGFSSSGGFQDVMPALYLNADGTQVTVTNGTTSTATRIINANFIEFHPDFVNQVISGQTTIAGAGTTTVDATVPTIDTNKTLVHMLGFKTDTAASNMNTSYSSVKVQSTTAIRSQRQAGSGTVTNMTSWNGLEFKKLNQPVINPVTS